MKKLPDDGPGGLTPNNLNLIRLAAALQVFFGHWARFFGAPHARWLWRHLVEPFPGVPIFFFVSGFLIAPSFRRSASVGDFYRKRFLRIYPALLVCLAACVLGMIGFRYSGLRTASGRSIAVWLIAQATFFQSYNPPWAKFDGTGLNIPLWTVMIELQFYAITPLLLARARGSARRRLGSLAVIFLGVSAYLHHWGPAEPKSGIVAFATFPFFFVPHLWMFLVGAWCSENKDSVIAAVRKWPGWFVPATGALLCLIPSLRLHGTLQFPFLAALVLKLAYADPTLADRTIGGTDISYGIYIYHYPMLQLALFADPGLRLMWLIPPLVLAVALVSWQWVEKPALSLKRSGREAIPG